MKTNKNAAIKANEKKMLIDHAYDVCIEFISIPLIWIYRLVCIRCIWMELQISNPDKPRRHGRCPLTPEEVGLMLRALGYGSDVHIYVASGEVYGGEETLAPLKALFPNFYSKDTIATKEELEPFYSFSSRMAALDFIVCDESDVFVTNNNGNMAKILAGRRYVVFLCLFYFSSHLIFLSSACLVHISFFLQEIFWT